METVTEFVDNLYNNTECYNQKKLNKKSNRGFYAFYACFPDYIQKLIDGKKFTDVELKNHPYYTYLTKLLHPNHQNPVTRAGHTYVLKKMRNAEKLLISIKKEGIKNPVDMAWVSGKKTFVRGVRRVVIAKLIGIKEVQVALYENRDLARIDTSHYDGAYK